MVSVQTDNRLQTLIPFTLVCNIYTQIWLSYLSVYGSKFKYTMDQTSPTQQSQKNLCKSTAQEWKVCSSKQRKKGKKNHIRRDASGTHTSHKSSVCPHMSCHVYKYQAIKICGALSLFPKISYLCTCILSCSLGTIVIDLFLAVWQILPIYRT